MWSFEGQYSRKPVQSLGGASRKEPRDNLLKRTQDERQKRQDLRQQQQSGTVIQAFLRGCKVREKTKHEKRLEFDLVSQSLQKAGLKAEFNLHQIHLLCRQLLFFYKKEEDGQRLTWLCQWLMKYRTDMAAAAVDKNNALHLYQLQRLLALCCRQLSEVADEASSAVTVPMRMLEVYLDSHLYQQETSTVLSKLLIYVVQKGYYFRCLRCLLETRVPNSLDRSVNPPTAMAGSILDLIQKPLLLVSTLPDQKLRNAVLECLCEEMFCREYSAQIKEFLLPALAYGRHPFPFLDLLHTLMPLYTGAVSNTLLDPDPQPLISAAERYGSFTASKEHWRGDQNTKQQDIRETSSKIKPSAFLLYALLHLSNNQIAKLGPEEVQRYLLVLHTLVPTLKREKKAQRSGVPLQQEPSDSSSDDGEMDTQDDGGFGLPSIQAECCTLLNEEAHVSGLLAAVGNTPQPNVVMAISTVGHCLVRHTNMPVNKTRLMYSLAYKPSFLRSCWQATLSASIRTVTGGQTSLLSMLSRGLELKKEELDVIIPLLSMFCSLFSYALLSLHDADFFGDDRMQESGGATSFQPFSLYELVAMSRALRDAALGIIELAHPDSRPDLLTDSAESRQRWAGLFKEIVMLVKQLYARDTRRNFCPPNHWLSSTHIINPDERSQLYRPNIFAWRPFASLSLLNPYRMQIYEEEGCSPLSTKEVRELSILQELPFVVPFERRVKIVHQLIRADRREQQTDHQMVHGGINITVRRNYLYEDAFEKLSEENEPNLRPKIRVQLMNFAGVDEAGIDGGGLFREFLVELLKTGFDPNRGFFCTNSDKLLYPNPNSKSVADNYSKHYYFLGRVLGKALYENLLVELPFASFFLSKILSRHRGDVDIHHLASLDPDMYKQLLFLKTYEGDISELGLDFTVTNDVLGTMQTEELKSGGKDITVNKSNIIEYIHLMADYRLNRQIRHQVSAFREGLAAVVSIDWLRMFNSAELQVLISGTPTPIDVDDLKTHTNYAGGYTADHPVMRMFWAVVEKFTDDERRLLLKFVTSCSRPPLLGFKDLYPAFCIQSGGTDLDRLPTASTCMNLLKLPLFEDKKVMAEKLVYAIKSGAGFELS